MKGMLAMLKLLQTLKAMTFEKLAAVSLHHELLPNFCDSMQI